MPTVPGDPMEDFFTAERQKLGLDRSVKVGARKTTQQLADEDALARRAGVPKELVAARPELKPDLEWQAKVMNTPIGELLGTAPKTAAYLGEHPDNFTAHQDGLTTLQRVEQKHKIIEDHRRQIEEANAKNGTGYFGGLANAFAQGANSLLTMGGDLSEMAVAKFGSPQTLQAFQRQREQGWLLPTAPLAGVLDRMGRKNLQYLRSGPQRQREDLLVRDPKTGEEQFNLGAINLENALAIVAGELPSFAVQAAAAPVTGGLSVAPKLAKLGKVGKVVAPLIKYGTRPTALMETARTATSIYDQGKQQMMAQGMSEEEAGKKVAGGALLAGLFSAAAGGPLEAKFFDDMVGKIASTPGGFGIANQLRARMKAVASMGAKEGVQEVVQGMGEDLAQWLTFQPDMTMKQAAGNAVMNFFGGAVMGGPAGGIALGSNQIAAAQQKDFLDAIHQGAENSPAYKLMPQKWQEAIAKITEGGPVENVAVPIERWATFWQSQGVDPAAKAAELGVTAEAYAEATQTGTDLTIKTAEFGAKIAGTEAYPELVQDIRWHSGEPTQREATEQKAELDGQVQEILAKIEAEPEGEIQAIAGKLVEDLVAAGRPKKEAEASGKLYKQFLATVSAREGMAPEELARQFPLTIANGQAQIGRSFEQRGPSLNARAAAGTLTALGDSASPLQAALDKIKPKVNEPIQATGKDAAGVEHSFTIQPDGASIHLTGEAGEGGRRVEAWFQVLPNGDIAVRSINNGGFRGLGPDMNRAILNFAKSNYEGVTDQSRVIGDLSEAGRKARERMGGTEFYQAPDGRNIGVSTVGAHFQGGNTLNQQGGPQLSALHNLSVENLIYADKMGGLAVPSVAVVKGNMGMSGFGGITLIGGRSLADPSSNPVFNADAYAPRFPRPEYAKAKSSVVQKFYDKLKPLAKEFNDQRVLTILWDYSVNTPDPEQVIREFVGSNMVKAAFLREKGEKVEPVVQPARVEAPFIGTAAWESFQKETGWDSNFDVNDKEYIGKLSKAISEGIDQWAASHETLSKEDAEDLADANKRYWLGDDGQFLLSKEVVIRRSLEAVGRMDVDQYATKDVLDEKLKGQESEFRAWVDGKVMPLFGEPFLKAGRSKVPYTLPNIVDAMTGAVKNQEKGMTFGEGAARAAMSKQFSDLEQMRDEAAGSMASEAEVAAAREEAKKLTEEYRTAVIGQFKGLNWKGQIDTWEALDASMRALAKMAKKKAPSDSDIRAALRSENFNVTNLTPETLALAQKTVAAFRSAPVPYFEAKPQRAVRLSEFSGAVIPESAPQEARDILDKHGIKWRTYKGEEDQQAATVALRQELAAEGASVLFQSIDLDSPTGGVTAVTPPAADLNTLFQAVYHGSPYRFDKFSLEHLGKGEGAQAYGWGLYFAGDKAVAEYYRNMLGNKQAMSSAEILNLLVEENGGEAIRYGDFAVREIQRRESADPNATPRENAERARRNNPDLAVLSVDQIAGVIEKIRASGLGQLYRVEIPDDGSYLLWDKPLSKQPKPVKDALKAAGLTAQIAKKVFGDYDTGAEIYKLFSGEGGYGSGLGADHLVRGSDREASLLLNQHGIKGIKYLDGSSRSAGEGSYNYVIFDDSAVNILQTFYQPEFGPKRYSSKQERISARMRKLAMTTRSAMDRFMAEEYLRNQAKQAQDDAEFAAFDSEVAELQRQFLESEGGTGGKRGALHIGPDHQMSLEVFEKANVSTVAHELGHFYLEVLRDLASREETSQQTKDDFATILKHFGEGEEGVTTLVHERFADAHLLYLREGKAPNDELRGAFQRFSRWLARIWGVVRAGMVDVELNPEVRGVFDRLYATETEIEAAKYDLGRPMFANAEAAGMTEAEFQAYLKTTDLAKPKEKMAQRLMHELERQQSKDRRDAFNAAKERITAEVLARPEYKALMALVNGVNEDGIEVKLSRGALVAQGIDPKTLGKDGIQVVYTSEGGMDPDTAALFLGYETGAELIQALTNLEPRKAIINRLATAEVEQDFPNTLNDPEALRKAAIEAMAESPNAERTLALELQALERRRMLRENPEARAAVREAEKEGRAAVKAAKDEAAREARQAAQDDRAAAREAARLPNMNAYREAARIMVQSMGAFKLTPYKYLLAQRKASAEAFKAMAKNDYSAAAEAKRQEITNHFLYLETTRVRQEMEDFIKWDSRFDVARFREKIGKAGGTFLEQIDALRLRFGLSERQLENMGTRQESLAQWIASNDMAEIDDRLADESWSKPYHAMTVAEVQMLQDALRNIKTLAYQEFQVLVNGRMVDKQAAAQAIVESIQANNNLKPLLLSGSKLDAKDKAINALKGFDATLVKIESVINWMDGGKVDGPAHRYLWDPLAQAQTKRYDMTVKIAAPLQEAFRQMPESIRHNLDETVLVEGFNQPLSRRQLISILLNMGNEVNQTKLVKGYNWTHEQLLAAVGKLTTEEAQFVQGLWDTVSSVWPEMVALEKRTTGVEPKKQEIRAFTLYNDQGQVTAELKGGYWPLKYDPQGSTDVGMKQNAADRLLQGSAARPGTSRSAVKERTNFVGELLLDFEHILTAHINDVIMDLSHREALNTVDKMIRMPEVKMAIQEAFGPAYYQQFQPWLKTIAGDNSSAAAMGLSVWSRAAMAIRSNTIAAVLGFKFTSTIVQFADVARVLGPGDYRVKSRYFTSAFLQLVGSPKETIAMVRDLSGEMRHRADNLDRDVRETLNRMTGQQSLRDRWNRAAFKGLAFMDALISVPAWLGAYQQAMAEHGDSDKAVAEADRVVRLKLMSGNPKDLIAAQRDNEMMKLVTMFLGDASSGYNMMRNAGHKAKGLKGFVTQFTPAAMVVMAGAVIGDLLKGAGPDDDEDETKWALRKAALAPFQTVPVLRDMVAALDASLAGKPFSDYRFTPAFTPVQKIIVGIDTTADLLGEEGKVDEIDWAIKSGEAIGYAFGIGGTAQAAGAAKYLRRVETGEENPSNPAEAVFNTIQGKPRKGTH